MGIITCPRPHWSDSGPSTCVQTRYLGNIVPLSILAVSNIVLVLNWIRGHHKTAQGFYYRPVGRQRHGPNSEHYQWNVCLSPIAVQTEKGLLLIDLAIGLGILAVGASSKAESLPIGSIVLTVYLAALAYGSTSDGSPFQSRTQRHVLSTYGIQWPCLILVAYSMVSKSHLVRPTAILATGRAILYTVLLFLHLSASQRPVWKSSTMQLEPVNEPSSDRCASVLSSVLFCWMENMIWKSYHGPLRPRGVSFVDYYRSARIIIGQYYNATRRVSFLIKGLFSFFWYDILIQAAWATVMSCTVFVPAILIRALLQHIIDGTLPRNTAWLAVFGLFISGTVTTIADTQAEWRGYQISAKVRAILDAQIYRKVQLRGIAVSSGSEEGNIINLMAADTEMVSMISANLHLAWIFFPVQLTVAIYLLYKIMGISGILGVLFMLLSLPLHFLICKREVSAQERVLQASDERIQASNEVLNTIRTIKYCAWELPFRSRVMGKRNGELKMLRIRFIWFSIAMTVFFSLPFLVTISTCFFYTVVFGHQFGTVVAFPALAIFAVLRIPLNRLSESISYLLQAYVSLTRIETFLRGPDNETSSYTNEISSLNDVVRFDDATLAWPTGSGKSTGILEGDIDAALFTLHNINLEIPKHSFTLVCGPTGSGKSSLLLALLGEMQLLGGKATLPHKVTTSEVFQTPSQTSQVAYCAQEPWIFNQSIRANILFGLSFSANRYRSVISATSLERDFADLDDGDRTLAGEGGNRLSGGQKQRVAIARALYSDAELVVLDDCLSALDQHTAMHVFTHAIRGPLMQNRTCVLATHHVRLTGRHCDHAVFMQDGRIEAQGRWDELVGSGAVNLRHMQDETDALDIDLEQAETEASSNTPSVNARTTRATEEEGGDMTDQALLEVAPNADSPQYEEKSFEGRVPWSKVRIYLGSMGDGSFWTLVLSAFIVQQLISLGLDLCIKSWARRYDESATTQPGQSNVATATFYLGVYGIIGLLYAIVTFLRDAITFYGSLKASSSTYQRMLDSILHAKLTFFDRVPIGQIINRFSNDVSVLDDSIATLSVSALQLAITILITIGLIAAIFPVFLIPTFLILLAYYAITQLYVGASRDLRRIENVHKSPLYQYLSEAISGHITIRAYGQTGRLLSDFNESIDKLNTPYLLQWAAKGWLTVRVGVMSAIIQCLTGAFVLWKSGSIDPGNGGLAMTYAATLPESVLWFVQIYAIVQQNLSSLERILEYTDVEQERRFPPLGSLPPAEWPSEGDIEFCDYTTKYGDDQSPVLKGVSFKVDAGQRVAVIGRTGAGKSSLTLALIRGLEAVGGKIVIDEVDIASLPLDRLREVITVVPQDPVLFSGTIRDNLDPLQQYTDEELLTALRSVRFSMGTVREQAKTVDTHLLATLAFTASQLSRGQRQLICIVRALLRKSRILVLDEATASIDHETDQQIQAGLRAGVSRGTTVLTIAHRLETIADYDHVVVLDAGRVVRQGSAREILGDESLRGRE